MNDKDFIKRGIKNNICGYCSNCYCNYCKKKKKHTDVLNNKCEDFKQIVLKR